MEPTNQSVNRNKKIILIVLSILIIVMLVWLWMFLLVKIFPPPIDSFTTNQTGMPAARDEDRVLESIGNIKIFQKDVDSYKQVYYDQTNEEVLGNMKKDLEIINTGINSGLVGNSEQSIQNLSPSDRRKLASNLEKEYREASVKISGNMITVFFFNQKLLNLSFQEADNLALQIINEIYQKVKSGEITPQQAITSLSTDIRVATIDWNYKNNTGITFKDVVAWDLTSDPLYLDTISKMPNSATIQLSPVLRYPGPKEKFGEDSYKPGDNGYYFFFVLDKREGKYAQSMSDSNKQL